MGLQDFIYTNMVNTCTIKSTSIYIIGNIKIIKYEIILLNLRKNANVFVIMNEAIIPVTKMNAILMKTHCSTNAMSLYWM